MSRSRTLPAGRALLAAALTAGATDIAAHRLLRDLLELGRDSRSRGLRDDQVMARAGRLTAAALRGAP